jgi:membrane-associated phospholipid phosphatase
MPVSQVVRALVAVSVVWVLGWGSGNVAAQEATAQTAGTPEEQQQQAGDVPEGGAPHTGFKTLVKDMGGDFKHMFSDLAPLLWLGAGGAGALIVHPLDDNVNEHFINAGNDAFWSAGQVLGLGYVQIGAAVGTWGIGRMVDRHGRAAHVGLDLLRAQVVTQTLTYGLKYSVQRDRPDGTSGYAFPSGHASTTFASAAVLQRHFGWKAGVPTYALATYVAASRLHDNRHYLSDVVFGSALGLAAGYTVTRHGRDHFALVPLAVPDGIGIALARIGA